ncbi:hypothetical protein E2C01_051560 [Portunus trituberculatus]|uniref:Uncharacterized protein n=1 Tax=Portunus trituberculatus TaxID=210409 RepID=A0A5B7GJW3_PORTR|nr:hypothetical protein [Portunus trituberculatus]
MWTASRNYDINERCVRESDAAPAMPPCRQLAGIDRTDVMSRSGHRKKKETHECSSGPLGRSWHDGDLQH